MFHSAIYQIFFVYSPNISLNIYAHGNISFSDIIFDWIPNICIKMTKTHLSTWFVQTITGCWLASCPSLTWSTTCTHKKSPDRFCILTNNIQDRSCSDCVTVKEDRKKRFSVPEDGLIELFICEEILTPYWYITNKRKKNCKNKQNSVTIKARATFRT